MTLEEVKKKIHRINKEKKQGVLHYLPFPDRLSRLDNLVGGIGKETNLIITSISGGSKSTLMYDLLINSSKELLDTYSDINVKITLFINILEESVESMQLREIVSRLSSKNINLNVKDLEGRKLDSFSEQIMNTIDECIGEIEIENQEYSEKLSVNWLSEPNGFGLYKKVREYAAQNGKFYLDNKEVFSTNNQHPKFDKYIPNNPNELVIVASDHIKLYSSESGKSWYESLEYFSQIYCRRIMNLKFGYATVNVQQQSSASEAIVFDNKGKVIIENTYPTLNKLGDITTTQRDATVALGIHNPLKYGVKKQVIGGLSIDYEAFREKGFEIRNIHILKNRFGGLEGSRLPCIVDYKTRKFYQLPKTQVEVDALLNN